MVFHSRRRRLPPPHPGGCPIREGHRSIDRNLLVPDLSSSLLKNVFKNTNLRFQIRTKNFFFLAISGADSLLREMCWFWFFLLGSGKGVVRGLSEGIFEVFE